mgnify:CR=1 FL=1
MYRDNLDDFDKIVTLSELQCEVEKEYKSMSEEEKYHRLRDCEPTFFEYCCSFMHTNNIEQALINEFTYKCEKLI